MEKKKKMVGLKHFNSKAGRECLVMTIETACDKEANARGYYGCVYEDIFVPEELFNAVTVKDIGKYVELQYTVNWGKAYLCGVSFA